MSIKQRLIGANILLTSIIYGIFSYIIPKKKGLILFYPAFGPHHYDGNLKPLFEYLSPRLPDGCEAVWISRSPEVVRKIEGKGLRAIRRFGRPLSTLLRAELIILDKNEPRLGLGRFRMVQTWHGTGFKRIALETPGISATRRKAFRWHFRHYELIVANCLEDQQRKARCFDNNNVKILGSPRNDMLVRGEPDSQALRAQLQVPADQHIISYCPTFRDSGVAVPFTQQGWQRLNAAVAASGSVLLVKTHGFDKAVRVPSGLSHIRNITRDVEDVMQLLAITDLLITDYSSIATDYALTGKPMLFYTYDTNDYQSRGARLLYNLFETLPGPFIAEEAALCAHIQDQSWFNDFAYQARYQAFRTRFHHFLDDGSTQRVGNAILARLNPAEQNA